MTDISINKKLHEVVDQLLGDAKPDRTLLGSAGPPFDISRPNRHDSKAEFLREKSVVEDALAHSQGLFDSLTRNEGEAPENQKLIERLSMELNESARRRARNAKVETVIDLVRKNIADSGFYLNILWVLADLQAELRHRLDELKSEEAQFWSVGHRPRNYYAHAIASRLARLYARQTGKRPTYGVAREGSHPSTDFGRSVQQIFEILGIRANYKKPTERAIEQLTEEDIKPQSSSPLTGLYGMMRSGAKESDPTIASGLGAILDLAKKDAD